MIKTVQPDTYSESISGAFELGESDIRRLVDAFSETGSFQIELERRDGSIVLIDEIAELDLLPLKSNVNMRGFNLKSKQISGENCYVSIAFPVDTLSKARIFVSFCGAGENCDRVGRAIRSVVEDCKVWYSSFFSWYATIIYIAIASTFINISLFSFKESFPLSLWAFGMSIPFYVLFLWKSLLFSKTIFNFGEGIEQEGRKRMVRRTFVLFFFTVFVSPVITQFFEFP